ncbi:MAG: hypothetical protein Q6K99_09060 [Thermostichales cyanobacterium BF4_bins_65]
MLFAQGAELHGQRISFRTFLSYGIPVMTLQLLTAALYILARSLL